ncbi:hypothetical protein EVAR_23322_1 [Eumeta japonica]|uniref:Uncharacterized protein n=1 Tax=Eumeta variegata TaxID=151549 RepID=A0A4C1XW42_EUMVA|nr:hypothetical protein EVAR_23322_1 [Eumeta japonica]
MAAVASRPRRPANSSNIGCSRQSSVRTCGAREPTPYSVHFYELSFVSRARAHLRYSRHCARPWQGYCICSNEIWYISRTRIKNVTVLRIMIVIEIGIRSSIEVGAERGPGPIDVRSINVKIEGIDSTPMRAKLPILGRKME